MHPIAHWTVAGMLTSAAACSLIAQTPSLALKSHIGRPYTAEFRITRVQTLSDGNTITTETTEIDARDSQGRTFRSTTSEEGTGASKTLVTRTSVNDPVQNTEIHWDSRSRTALRVNLPPEDANQGCWTSDSGTTKVKRNKGPVPGGAQLAGGTPSVSAHEPQTHVEDLGDATIQGTEAHGERVTRIVAAGEMGNDQPIVTVSEDWVSQELGLVLRDSSEDPLSGRRTRELLNLALAEPDPSLFQLPPGYEVTSEDLHQVGCAAPR